MLQAYYWEHCMKSTIGKILGKFESILGKNLDSDLSRPLYTNYNFGHIIGEFSPTCTGVCIGGLHFYGMKHHVLKCSNRAVN